MSSAYSQCSTVELLSHDMENGDGLEPPNRGFAVPRITNFATRSEYLTKKTHKLHKDYSVVFLNRTFSTLPEGPLFSPALSGQKQAGFLRHTVYVRSVGLQPTPSAAKQQMFYQTSNTL